MNAHSQGCTLCGLPLRYASVSLNNPGNTYHFCCMGCKQVFSMLMQDGASSDPSSFKDSPLFKTCREMGIIPASENDLRAQAKDTLAASCDASAPEDSDDLSDRPESPAADELDLGLTVDGMWCPACAWIIEAGLKKLAGIHTAACNFSTDRLYCSYDPVLTSPAQIMEAVQKLGYRPALPGEQVAAGQKRSALIRFAVCAFLTANVMMLSFGLYAGFFSQFTPDTVSKLSWPMFAMASVVLFYGGRPIYGKALAGMTFAAFSMETLITVGAFSAYLYSTVNLFAGSIHLFFDTVAMLITLVLLGKTLEAKAKADVNAGLENFFALRPSKAKICSDQFPEGRYAAAENLRQGDVFRIEAGEIVPADGIILAGTGSVEESSITGEALPVDKKPGDRITSGVSVIRGSLRIEATGVGNDSTLGQMIDIMQQALGGKTVLEGKTDALLKWFVPVVLALAAGTGCTCLTLGYPLETAVIRTLTVLLISCPCALGIAIPLARVAGIFLANRRGMLVRDFSGFETAERINAFVFDKTGTITKGHWELLEIVAFDPFTTEQVLALAAALEQDSAHFIAREIKRRAARIRQASVPEIAGVVESDNGISGYLEGREVRLGAREFLGPLLNLPHGEHAVAQAGSYSAQSRIYMSLDGSLCAMLIFGDTLRPGARAAIATLKEKGYAVFLVSGDGDRSTKTVARMAGIDNAQGGKLPQDKVSFIEALQKSGHCVAMVGDGINDAPALARSDLAVAVHSGSHLGKEVADITLMRGDPGQILRFLQLAKSVNRNILQNLACAFFYNLISIPLAMIGWLTPLVAVCAMLLSSLSVTVNTLLLIRRNPVSPNADQPESDAMV